MKICVVGNSHLAALKNGWDECKSDYKDIDLFFFGSTRDRMLGLSVTNDVIAPAADNKALLRQLEIVSGGKTSIRPSEYDAFIVYGLLLRVPPLDYRWSEAVSKLTCSDAYRASVASYVVSLIRAVSDRKILVGPVPLKSSPAKAPHVRSDRLVSYEKSARFLGESVANSGAQFVRQPSETIGDGWFTKDAYSKGAVSLIGGKNVEAADTLHMNSMFGEKCIHKMIKILTGE